MSNEKKIYILLTDTGTLFTKLIKLVTKSPMNHASISFNQELSETYSFGRKNPVNPFVAGFVRENMEGSLFTKATCALYSCTVESSQYEQMYAHVKNIEENKQKYKYNMLGLFGILFNFKWERKHAFFCSQFVASVFEQNGMNLVGKPSVLTTPGDFQHSDALQLLFQGSLNRFHMQKCSKVSSKASSKASKASKASKVSQKASIA
ncbi:hypothetical protein [Paenibacillus eucommiae]|uniref:Uncharacterized protein n=1 Tax=Paenibacillus eucommiae TaxID=1355755 RepID=A0ABS4INH8_9BACL|nr:hypothetical protein [Paenibacillus eucommiae]MBP1989118.1 hypothetical protein [Paenibacillus eucommiae]